MAMAKKKPAIEMVFGMGGKPAEGETDADESHAEATDTLKAALSDAGVDASDALMSALHQYVEACIKSPPPAEEAAEGEEY